MDTDEARERGRAGAETAREQAQQVGETVKEQARSVAEQAKERSRDTASEIGTSLHAKGDEEAGRFAGNLRRASAELRSMVDQQGEPVHQDGVVHSIARQGADVTERLADRLDDEGLDGLVADVRAFARRRPGAFLLGAAAAGFLTGRLGRSIPAVQSESRSEQPSQSQLQAQRQPQQSQPAWEEV